MPSNGRGGSVMRAVVRHHYGEWPRTVDLPTPTPGEGEVRVRVVASSLNTADLDVALGRPKVARLGTGFRRPRRAGLGIDVAGVVDALGGGVTTLSLGDEVWGDVFGRFGAFAEHVVAPAELLSPKPAAVSFEDAACVPHSGLLALQALSARGGVRRGDRVLVNGGGGCVGPFAIQIATAWGAEVTAVDTAAKSTLMERAGAVHVVDCTTTDCTRTNDRYDLVVDIAVNRNLLAYRRVLADGGRYTQVARDLSGFFTAAVLGGRRMGNFAWKAGDPVDLGRFGDLMASGAVAPIVDRVCGLDDVPAELRRLSAGEARGKIVVRV